MSPELINVKKFLKSDASEDGKTIEFTVEQATGEQSKIVFPVEQLMRVLEPLARFALNTKLVQNRPDLETEKPSSRRSHAAWSVTVNGVPQTEVISLSFRTTENEEVNITVNKTLALRAQTALNQAARGNISLENQTIDHRDIHIDGGSFERSFFTNCKLTYSGGDVPKLSNVRFRKSQFVLEGAALNTLMFFIDLNAWDQESAKEIYLGIQKMLIEKRQSSTSKPS